jgi:uncharacterized protein
MYFLIFGLFMLLSLLVSQTLKSKFKKFSEIPIVLTGAEVAKKMLRENGIYDVEVTSVEGQLTDHYNPQTKTVNLSHDVYFGLSIASAAVAAHECGHALQHATSYAWLQMRSSLVPVVSFASNIVQWVLLAGIILVNIFPQLLLFGIILFTATTVFSFITLPVEINASHRALAWLNRSGLTNFDSQPKAEEALRWAAYTYVIAAVASLATLFYYFSIYSGRRN